ncbi:hypothetical protein VRK_40600 [Vibrio sp. MEBiC08052]|nr:hypothetical protein VRK_40600 [Vibrio sp. MEBiC08052]
MPLQNPYQPEPESAEYLYSDSADTFAGMYAIRQQTDFR